MATVLTNGNPGQDHGGSKSYRWLQSCCFFDAKTSVFICLIFFWFVFFWGGRATQPVPHGCGDLGRTSNKNTKKNKKHKQTCVFTANKTTKWLGRDEKRQKHKAHRVFVEKDSARSGPELRSLTKYSNYCILVFFCLVPINLLFFLL
jgi:hypothetical protein